MFFIKNDPKEYLMKALSEPTVFCNLCRRYNRKSHKGRSISLVVGYTIHHLNGIYMTSASSGKSINGFLFP